MGFDDVQGRRQYVGNDVLSIPHLYRSLLNTVQCHLSLEEHGREALLVAFGVETFLYIFLQ